MGTQSWPLEAAVDSARYPIADLGCPSGRSLVESSRAQLADSGACVLEGFLRADAARQSLDAVSGLLGAAYYCEKRHNPYLDPQDPAFPGDHPRNRPQVSDVGALADDQIPHDTLLQRLYRWPTLRAFVAAVLQVPELHPYADPLGSLNLNVFRPGQQLGWHFDNADWAVTLMLQPAEAGGIYEYAPWTRDGSNQNYEAIAAILDGGRAPVRELAMDIGALVLFRGRQSLHRVTPVKGDRPRLVAVLSYDTQPGVMLTEHNRRLFFGRVA